MKEIFENSGKVEKASAAYREYSDRPKETCADCANFTYPNRCAIVKGDVAPEATCDLFEPNIDKRASVFRGFVDGLKV